MADEALLKKGDHVIYSVIGNVGTAQVQGIMALKVVKVKKGEYLVDVLPKGVPFLKRARLTFPIDEMNLADIGGVLAGWSVRADGTRMGEEVVPTKFGDRTLVRYQRIEVKDDGNVQTEQFVDPVHNFPYAARMSGSSGEVQFGIMETNIAWIKEA
jgi:hypothetical protein